MNITRFFSVLCIDLILLRQTYNHGVNMVGKENSTQDNLWPKFQEYFFVPCTAYSLCVLLRVRVRIMQTAMVFFGVQRV